MFAPTRASPDPAVHHPGQCQSHRCYCSAFGYCCSPADCCCLWHWSPWWWPAVKRTNPHEGQSDNMQQVAASGVESFIKVACHAKGLACQQATGRRRATGICVRRLNTSATPRCPRCPLCPLFNWEQASRRLGQCHNKASAAFGISHAHLAPQLSSPAEPSELPAAQNADSGLAEGAEL